MVKKFDAYDDEIDLALIFQKFWVKRGLILIIPFLTLVILTALILIKSSLYSDQSLSLYINLKGIKEGTYPNGTTFSTSDLLSNDVISDLAEKNNIRDVDSLKSALSSEYAAINESKIFYEFQNQLDNNKLNASEINAVNEQFLKRINAAKQNSLKITFMYSKLSLSQNDAETLLRQVPETWVNVFGQKHNILLNTKIHKLDLANDQNVNSKNYLLDHLALTLNKKIRLATDSLDAIIDDSRLRSVLNEKGQNAIELSNELSQLNTTILSPSINNLIAKGQGASRFYQMNLLEQKKVLDKRLEKVEQTSKMIADIITQRSSNKNIGLETGVIAPMDLNATGINEIQALSKDKILAEYLTKNLDLTQNIVTESESIQSELRKINWALGNSIPKEFPPQLLIDKSNEFFVNYNSLIDASLKFFEDSFRGNLFETTALVPSKYFSNKEMLIVIALTLLAFAITSIYALLTPTAQPRVTPGQRN